MLYAILCYNDEKQVFSWNQEQDDAVMARLHVVHERLAAEGKIGPSLRLQETSTARTLHKGHQPPLVVDGPFAETKEALLGFYVVDVATRTKRFRSPRIWSRPTPASAPTK